MTVVDYLSRQVIKSEEVIDSINLLSHYTSKKIFIINIIFYLKYVQ